MMMHFNINLIYCTCVKDCCSAIIITLCISNAFNLIFVKIFVAYFLSHPSPFAQNHPLNLLNNLTALGMSAQHLQNLPHSDVLEKLKMQVRDMKVGLMDPDFSSLHAAAANYGVSMQNAANFAQSMTHNANPNGFTFQSPNSGNKDGEYNKGFSKL